MIETCHDGGINWMWYAEIEIVDDDTVTIFRHYRLHKDRDYPHPDAPKPYRMIEDEKRVVVAINIAGHVYTVANPQYVFSYGDKE